MSPAPQASPCQGSTPTNARATVRLRPGCNGKTARERRLDRTALRFLTFNVRSLRRPEAYDLLINYMRTHNIHVAAVQETWLPGTHVETNTGFTFVRHNAEGKPGKRGGVAIVLDPLATAAWNRAGNDVEYFSPRVMGVKLEFANDKGSNNIVRAFSAYAPTSGHDPVAHALFQDALADAHSWCAESDIVLLGGDFNASLGICRKTDVSYESVAATPSVGPHGIRHVNAAGRRLRAFAEMHALRAATTFFKSQKRRKKQDKVRPRKRKRKHLPAKAKRHTRHDDSRFRTWIHPRSGNPFQLDHIFVNQSQARRVLAARVVRDDCARIGSDHRPVLLDLRLGKGSLTRPSPRAPSAQRSALRNAKVRTAFCEAIHAKAREEDRAAGTLFPSIDVLAKAMIAAKDETLVVPPRKTPSWMGNYKMQILSASRVRDAAMSRVEGCLHNSKRLRRARSKLHAARRKLRKLVNQARSKWIEDVVDTKVRFVRSGGAPLGAAEAWAGIKELRDGPTDTKKAAVTPLYMADGKTLCKNDAERCKVFTDHFEKQLNQAESFDPTALEEIPQLEVLTEFDEVPTAEEVRVVFARAKNGKAAGPNSIAAEHWKAAVADPDLFGCIVQLVQVLFVERQVPEDWKLSTLLPLPKKGDLKLATNWRPIMLRDAAAKIVTLIFGLRIGKIYERVGRESQCGFCNHRGTVDGIVNVKSVVQLRREAGLPTWALWVDLRKAFDTVSRKMMVLVLAKYGVPPRLCAIFEALYATANVQLIVGDSSASFDNHMGVFQGCGSSPALFNFMVDAWFAAVTPKLREHVLSFRSSDATAAYGTNGRASNMRGRDIGDTSSGSAFDVLEGLYADDAGTFVGSRESLQAVGGVLLKEGLRWGMKMHSASTADINAGKKSKTEFTFFPVPGHHPEANAVNAPDTSPIEIAPGRWVTEATINVDGVNILGFKYLGVVITPCLRDDVEIRLRISAAGKAFGALRDVFKCPSLPHRCKGTIFAAYVTSLLFYGCEAWALRRDHEREIATFFNTCARRICDIGKWRQWRQHTHNAHLRSRLGIRASSSYIEERTLRWLGHVARMKESRLPRLLLFGWAPRSDGTRRARGAPQTSINIRAHKLLLRVSKCKAVPEDLRAGIASTFVPPALTARQGEAAAALTDGRNPYGIGNSRCAAQQAGRGTRRWGAPVRCEKTRRLRHLTCEDCNGLPAAFGAYADESFATQCAAVIASSRCGNTNRRCSNTRRPGFLTCQRHWRQPATFDPDGSNGSAHVRGWVDVAAGPTGADEDARNTARDDWKVVVATFCDIPPVEKRARDAGWSVEVDDAEFGAWPKASDAERAAQPVEAWTDGSSLNNGQPDAAAGAGVYFSDDSPLNISQSLTIDESQTNNRGELTAILLALRRCEKHMREQTRIVRLYTDSAYAIGCFGNAGRKCRHRGWKNSKRKEAANVDLLKMALMWRQVYGDRFEFVHVYAHTGKQDRISLGNHGADRLAVAGAEQKGSVAVALRVVAPGAPAGSELIDDACPSQARDASSQFDL